ncbi:unnamed protein product, partial [Rotaria sp. Silwood1]
HFPTFFRAVSTFEGVPEGAYYERIFHLFPLLRVCHLRFWSHIQSTLDHQILLPLGKAFMPIQTSLLNVQSITLRDCSPDFLSHLLEHLPQLQELSFNLSTSWLPAQHPLMNGDNNRISGIDKHLAPNLRCLKITSKYDTHSVAPLDRLFERDVWFSLTNFKLLGLVTGPHVIHNLLSMLSDQCLYVLIVKWYAWPSISLSDTSDILLNTFRQLKGRVPIELELSLNEDNYSIRALTIPRMDKCLSAYDYVNKNTVQGQSLCPYTVPVLNNRAACVNKIIMDSIPSQDNDEFLSYLPTVVSWHQITSLSIDDPFNLAQLHLLFLQTTNLRTLQLDCSLNPDSKDDSKEQNVIDLLNDASLCNILMSNGLQRLNLDMNWEHPNMTDIAVLIVKRLPHLQVIELDCNNTQVPETLDILMKGLPKLNFIIFHGGLRSDVEEFTRMRDLRKYSTRAYRTENYYWSAYGAILYVGL